MSIIDDDFYDDDEYDDYELDDDDDEDDDDEDDDDEDLYDRLEYLDTCQIVPRDEIIDDIVQYLRRYQPMYKIVKRKEL